MFSLLALILIPLGGLFLWPLTDYLLADEKSPLLAGLTAFSLSIGLLGLVWFWLGAFPGRIITSLSGLLVIAVGLAAGIALNLTWFTPRRWRAYWLKHWQRLMALDPESILLWTLIGLSAIIITNALYYPFIGEDVLIRYGQQAQEIYAAGRIPRSQIGYPPLMPLSFVGTWFAAGGVNEHLARLIPALMAIGMLGATYLVGRQTGTRRTGLLAAVVLGLTPVFVNSATLAYTDIPTAFPLTLALYFLIRWWQQPTLRRALFAGILVGIAIFTKQSAMIWWGVVFAIPLARLVMHPERKEGYRPWRTTFLGWMTMLGPAFLLGLPWYLRNVILADWRYFLPIAGEFHLADANAEWLGLLPPLAYPASFGWPAAIVYTLGWLFGLWLTFKQATRLIARNLEQSPFDLILAASIIPYWMVWYIQFSFDARFLLLIQPVMAIWSARLVLQIIDRIPPVRAARRYGSAALGLLLMGLLFIAARDRLGGVYKTITQPFASDFDRLEDAKGELLDLAIYIRANLDPESDRLYIMDERLAYYLPEYDYQIGYPQHLRQLEDFDYLVHASGIHGIYASGRNGWYDTEFYLNAFNDEYFEPVYESNGVHIMRILPSVKAATDEK